MCFAVPVGGRASVDEEDGGCRMLRIVLGRRVLRVLREGQSVSVSVSGGGRCEAGGTRSVVLGLVLRRYL